MLSGLTERSNGDGYNKATVHHILLTEDLEAGRLKRRAGDFLCTSKSGSNGKDWSNQREAYSGAKVTCKHYLEIAGRFMDNKPQVSSCECGI